MTNKSESPDPGEQTDRRAEQTEDEEAQGGNMDAPSGQAENSRPNLGVRTIPWSVLTPALSVAYDIFVFILAVLYLVVVVRVGVNNPDLRGPVTRLLMTLFATQLASVFGKWLMKVQANLYYRLHGNTSDERAMEMFGDPSGDAEFATAYDMFSQYVATMVLVFLILGEWLALIINPPKMDNTLQKDIIIQYLPWLSSFIFALYAVFNLGRESPDKYRQRTRLYQRVPRPVRFLMLVPPGTALTSFRGVLVVIYTFMVLGTHPNFFDLITNVLSSLTRAIVPGWRYW